MHKHKVTSGSVEMGNKEITCTVHELFEERPEHKFSYGMMVFHGTRTPFIRVPGGKGCRASRCQLLRMCPLEGGRGWWLHTGAPAIHVGDPDAVPGSWPWPGPAPVIRNIWYVNQQMESVIQINIYILK